MLVSFVCICCFFFSSDCCPVPSWWVALVQHEESPLDVPLAEAHDVVHLTRLRDALNLEQTTLGQMKVRAQEAVDRRTANVERKLNPLESDRQEVRAKVGEQAWKNNPAPKLTYAERIALLHAELQDLAVARGVLQSLQLPQGPLPRGAPRRGGSGGGRGGGGGGAGRGRGGASK